jgi:type II secretory pathway pseudopilin PulG
VRTGARHLRGTTLVELLIAVVFLAICTSSILACVWNSQTQGTYANRRSAVLAAIQAQIYTARGQARLGSLTPGATTTPTAVQGLSSSLGVTTTISLWPGYTNLYLVTVSASWTEESRGVNRSDSLSISTLVRAPDA